MSTLVTTVVMATLVVGPFYLSGEFALDAARVGLVMSSGPMVAALTGVLAGRIVDHFDAHRMTIAGLIGMAAGSSVLPMVPMRFGFWGTSPHSPLSPPAMRCSRRPTTRPS